MNKENNVPIKPKFGEPCNGCGFCCLNEVCALGVEAFDTNQTPCPGLILSPSNNRFYCKLVLIENAVCEDNLIAQSLGIGRGCDTDCK